jgi:hypothetical protein
MNRFHWILFSFCMAQSKVFFFDSLYKTTDKTRYQDIVELIKIAWTCPLKSTPESSTKTFLSAMIGQYVSQLIYFL